MNHAPMNQTYSEGALVGASIALLVTVALALPLFVPSLRSDFRWGDGNDDDPPMSLVGKASWALAALAFTVTLTAEGIHYSPITANTGTILFTAFGIVLLAGVTDSIINRKK